MHKFICIFLSPLCLAQTPSALEGSLSNIKLPYYLFCYSNTSNWYVHASNRFGISDLSSLTVGFFGKTSDGFIRFEATVNQYGVAKVFTLGSGLGRNYNSHTDMEYHVQWNIQTATGLSSNLYTYTSLRHTLNDKLLLSVHAQTQVDMAGMSLRNMSLDLIAMPSAQVTTMISAGTTISGPSLRMACAISSDKKLWLMGYNLFSNGLSFGYASKLRSHHLCLSLNIHSALGPSPSFTYRHEK